MATIENRTETKKNNGTKNANCRYRAFFTMFTSNICKLLKKNIHMQEKNSEENKVTDKCSKSYRKNRFRGNYQKKPAEIIR